MLVARAPNPRAKASFYQAWIPDPRALLSGTPRTRGDTRHSKSSTARRFVPFTPTPFSPRGAASRESKGKPKTSAVQGPRQVPSKFLVRKAPLRGHTKPALYPRKIPGAVVERATSHLGGPGDTQLGESPPKAELEIVRSQFASEGSGLHKRLCSPKHLAHTKVRATALCYLGSTPLRRGLKGRGLKGRGLKGNGHIGATSLQG